MDRRRLTLSLAAVLAALCLYYRGGLALLPLLLLPVAAHELSHVLALRLLGRRITSFRLDAQGFVIGCTGGSALSDVLIALAGPLVPAPTSIRDLLTMSLPSFKITHLDAVEPTSMPSV